MVTLVVASCLVVKLWIANFLFALDLPLSINATLSIESTCGDVPFGTVVLHLTFRAKFCRFETVGFLVWRTARTSMSAKVTKPPKQPKLQAFFKDATPSRINSYHDYGQ